MGRGVKQLQALQVPDDLVSPRVHPGETAVIWLIPPQQLSHILVLDPACHTVSRDPLYLLLCCPVPFLTPTVV
jgi:hypothetical protein